MTNKPDLVIRNGEIFDGSGEKPFHGDIAIKHGMIMAVGDVAERGLEEIDASGLMITPGFVDIHTHYDGHVTWEGRMIPSTDHGVTTIVTGNCGVGFAPVRSADKERLVALMAGVEDIPEVVMTEGLSWNWRSFPEYMDVVASIPHDVDVALQIPHSALRVFVMGDRAVNREDATDAEIAEMTRLVREALRAGAVGFGTSRSLFQRSINGEPIPTVRAAKNELLGIATALRDEQRGVFQLLTDFEAGNGIEDEFGIMRDVARTSGRPLSFTLHQKDNDPDGWRRILGLVADANDEGLQIRAQVIGRPTGILLGFELSMHPFIACPSYQSLLELPFEQRIAALRDPDMRARLIAEEPAESSNLAFPAARFFGLMYELGDPPNYEPDPVRSIQARASADGISAAELAYDLMMKEDGHAILFLAGQDYMYGNLEVSREMMENRYSILGLGDGGAHCGVVCDSSYPTHMLAYWGRDRVRGARFSLPWIVRALSYETARAVGFSDRGLIRPGYIADLNLIDFERLQLGRPAVEYTLPARGRRLVQRAKGYVATIKSGVVTYREGVHSGALPGRLLRAGTSVIPSA